MDQIKETNKPHSPFMTFCKIIYFLLPLPVAWFSLSLMSMHMKYYDIGVNSAANDGFLMLFVLPVLLIILYAVAIISLYLARRFHKPQWKGFFAGILLIFIIGIGSFMVHACRYADYPTEKPKNMMSFFEYYFGEKK